MDNFRPRGFKIVTLSSGLLPVSGGMCGTEELMTVIDQKRWQQISGRAPGKPKAAINAG
jgi:hypothetical protein